MSKATMILDKMPESCNYCKFLDFGQWDKEIVATCFAMNGMFVELNTDKPDWCPLIEMPDRLDKIGIGTYYDMAFANGWNAYRGTLVGEENEGTEKESES